MRLFGKLSEKDEFLGIESIYKSVFIKERKTHGK